MASSIAALLPPDPTLNLSTCDRCSSRGHFHFYLPSGLDMVFCGHHSHMHRAALAAAGALAMPMD